MCNEFSAVSVRLSLFKYFRLFVHCAKFTKWNFFRRAFRTGIGWRNNWTGCAENRQFYGLWRRELIIKGKQTLGGQRVLISFWIRRRCRYRCRRRRSAKSLMRHKRLSLIRVLNFIFMNDWDMLWRDRLWKVRCTKATRTWRLYFLFISINYFFRGFWTENEIDAVAWTKFIF